MLREFCRNPSVPNAAAGYACLGVAPTQTRARLADGTASRCAVGGHLSAQKARRAKTLLAVWVAEEGVYRFPPFQPASPAVQAVLPELLEVLPATSGSGWDQIEWLFAPNALLGAKTQAEAILKILVPCWQWPLGSCAAIQSGGGDVRLTTL